MQKQLRPLSRTCAVAAFVLLSEIGIAGAQPPASRIDDLQMRPTILLAQYQSQERDQSRKRDQSQNQDRSRSMQSQQNRRPPPRKPVQDPSWTCSEKACLD